MLLGKPMHMMLQRVVLLAMISVLGITPVLSAFAQTAPPASRQGGISWKVCEHPPTCFGTKEARQHWAQQNNCRFLEDVCETPPDKGGWGKSAFGTVGDIARFVNGLVDGLIGQLGDLWDMVTNLGEALEGIAHLAKSFIDDPQGTLIMLAELLGQEAIDAMTKSTMCGPYDLGKVIGTYVSPVVALKIASRLTKYGGKLEDAVRVLKRERGCASFAAGTPIWTPNGMLPIESISSAQQVLSRHEASFADQPQAVLQTFGRVAPGYRLLTTEAGIYKVTDEHPLWVQGKGWTEASQVVAEDVIASARGDTLVTGNEAVNEPLRVYNFSVANTPNYFVGIAGLWAHNVNCRLLRTGSQLHGKSEGGPGVWEGSSARNGGEAYQEYVTGVERGTEYAVPFPENKTGKVVFDGWDADRKVLLDAKDWTGWPPELLPDDRQREWKLKAYGKLVETAKKQVRAANGVPIEWHLPDQAKLDAVRELFDVNEIEGIELVLKPFTP